MGIFKKLGSKLKRVISIKNLTNVATGNFSAVAKDVVRVATTEKPVKAGQPMQVDSSLISPNFQIPAPAMDVIEGQGKAFGDKVSRLVGSQKTVQEASGFITDVYLESMYQKYKTWITLFFVAIVGFILYKVLGRKKPPVRSKYGRK